MLASYGKPKDCRVDLTRLVAHRGFGPQLTRAVDRLGVPITKLAPTDKQQTLEASKATGRRGASCRAASPAGQPRAVAPQPEPER